MILTRTHLNRARPGARKLLGSPRALHAAVLAGFPPGTDPGRVLWRADGEQGPTPTLYVVSRSAPDFTHIDEQAGWPSRSVAESAWYGDFLDQVEAGQEWGFRVTVNPTHRVQRGGRSQILAHVTVAQQTRWLLERGGRIGVNWGPAPTDDAPDVTLVGRAVRTFNRDGATVTMSTATFQGTLRVVDADLLRSALTDGIGRGKAYGCGLMTLARL